MVPLYRCKAKLESRLRTKPACTKTTIHIDQSPEVRESLLFWMRFVLNWKGAVPMVVGFGPFRLPDVRGWVDTSGEHMHALGRPLVHPVVQAPPGVLQGAVLQRQSGGPRREVHRLGDHPATIELQGIHIWARMFFPKFCARKSSLIETDSETASQALARGFSGNTVTAAGMLSAVRDSNMLACRF